MDQTPAPNAAATAKSDGARSPFDGPSDDAVDLHFGLLDRLFIAALSADGTSASGARRLLPDNADLAHSAATKRQSVSLPLCEFLAYRAALAYEGQATVKANVGSYDTFAFFDSKSRVGDTQGYGFLLDGVAYIIMRGTESRSDWAVNLDDALTDTLAVAPSWWMRQRLRWRYGNGVLVLVDRVKGVRGRHRGFALAWAAVDDDVMRFVGALPAGTPIVLSGHSLGGALAQIGAFELACRDHTIAAVVTFGAPNVGNAEFKTAYNAKLETRTVLLESKTDSVPRVMRRWYYRLNRELQQFVVNLIEPPQARASSANFLNVGAIWPFAKEPVLKETDFENAVRAILTERENTIRRQQEMQEKSRKEAAEKAEKSKKDAAEPAGKAAKDSPPDAKSTSAGTAKTDGQNAGTMVLMIVAAVVIVVVLLLMWVFIRGKLSSHAIMHRYALYLSTLSYQRIRSFHAGSPDGPETALRQAEQNLDKYLRFIRGVRGDYKGTFYESVARLPVRLKPNYDLATFSSRDTNII